MSALESSMVWAPLEAMSQVTRNAQKVVAKDTASLLVSAKALAELLPKESSAASASPSSASTPTLTAGQLTLKTKMAMLKAVQNMLKEAQGLKRKLDESEKLALKNSRLCAHRLHYLAQVDMLAAANKNGDGVEYEQLDDDEGAAPSASSDRERTPTSASTPKKLRNAQDMDTDGSSSASAAAAPSAVKSASKPAVDESEPPSFAVTPQLRIDRMFAEHLLRTNRPATAAALIASSPPLANLLDADIFASGRRIEESLLSGDCTRALAWCGENRSRLNKIRSTLEFDLRLQEFLTLVQKQQTSKAIEYAQKFLAPAAITTAPATAAAAGAPPATTTLDRTNSLPTPAPPASTTLLQRNNSLQVGGGGAGEEKKDDDGGAGAAAQQMVADPARVKILQEAMNLLVFYGFEQEDPAAASRGSGSGAAGNGEDRMTDASSPTATLSANDASSVHVPPAWHKYRVYWSPHRFVELVSEFRRNFLEIYGLPSRSALEYTVHVGLEVTKTNSCSCPADGHHAHRQQHALQTRSATNSPTPGAAKAQAAADAGPSSAALACPACTPPYSCLASSLPAAQRMQSRLVCRITGALMDDRNPPMVLPNGYVYSRAALNAQAKLNNGTVTCPQTKQSFALSQAKIAYVL